MHSATGQQYLKRGHRCYHYPHSWAHDCADFYMQDISSGAEKKVPEFASLLPAIPRKEEFGLIFDVVEIIVSQ